MRFPPYSPIPPVGAEADTDNETGSPPEAPIAFAPTPFAPPGASTVPAVYDVLLVDDDAGVRSAVAEALEAAAGGVLRVRTSPNAREAIAEYMAKRPDLVILDLGLPDEDGWKLFELLERIRPFTPSVVITARPDQRRHAECIGVDALLEKPLDLDRLSDEVLRCLSETESLRISRLCRRSAFLAPRLSIHRSPASHA